MNKTYPSAIDTWLIAALFMIPVLLMTLGIICLFSSVVAGLVQIIIGIVVTGMIIALMLPCNYTLEDQVLKIKSGLLSEELDLHKIKGVELSSSLMSGPALSLKRVKITLDDGYRLISPKDRSDFVTSLKQKLADKTVEPTA